MKNYVIAALAATMIAPAAHALTLDESQVKNVGFEPTELNATLNFDGYTGSGTVTEVKLGFRGVIDSDINISNISENEQEFSAETVSEFTYTSPVGSSIFDVGAGTGPQTIAGEDTASFNVDDDNTSGLTLTGGDITPFLSAFDVGLDTETFIRISGGGGQVAGGQNTDGFGEVTVQYFVEDPIAPIPLPAAAWMMLAALGSLFAVRRFSKT